MPLNKYPFSERYGWIQDKYGLCRQLTLSDVSGKDRPFITPSLLFAGDVCGKAEEAGNDYLSIFRNTKGGIIARDLHGMDSDAVGRRGLSPTLGAVGRGDEFFCRRTLDDV
jgi:predicted 3-demethylubiquinone-9 3-methyltransferase (glyoxalase superfamily)